MCLSCGCFQPANPHGDDRNIMLADLQAATATKAGQGLTVLQAANNIARTMAVAIGADPVQAFIDAYDRPTLVFDIDGILAFLAEAICASLNAKFGMSLHAAAMTNYRIEDTLPPVQTGWLIDQFKRPLIYDNSAPDLRAVDALNAARAAGFVTRIASDRRDASLDAETKGWLARWDVGYDSLDLLGPGGKTAYMAQFNVDNPAVLIDDDPAKQIAIPGPGVQVWTPVRPWTPSGIRAGVWKFADWPTFRARLGIQ